MRYFFLIVLVALFSRCSSSYEEKIYIATAANVQFAMEELADQFFEETGIKCEIIIGSSGKLMAQIREGAPFHVFVSADMKYPQTLYEDQRTTGPPVIYARGELILWSLDTAQELSVAALTQPRFRKIAMANPRTAPYGIAAEQVLRHYQLFEQVSDKLVFGESISQTNQFILSGTSQAGFTAKSVVLSPAVRNKGRWIEIDPVAYAPIEQGIVVIKTGDASQKAAESFLEFILSDRSQAILKRFGYITEEIR
ncbi:molybdate ABC transporter substrate-binding protein [Fulvivirga sedimenti]|uniref:Molybdate ABC transporter substrate-binding protein n=1 Tax=Fulvivirga sedimenti TaxID=2879465 RepID=A0A9X1HJU6_9BACT|nr:molybdate ABC transporter substrate-binding protein [Fulvivirga sedimenti]MCA6073494.1 molybdate ABC transporter substrate-binding protein [Fulvivirga sedimenti]